MSLNPLEMNLSSGKFRLGSLQLQNPNVAGGFDDVVTKQYVDTVAGPQGNIGPQGTSGFQGTTGSAGGAGVQGVSGVQGFQGSGSGSSIIAGTPSANEITVFNGATGIQGSPNLTYDDTNSYLALGGAASQAAGINLDIRGSGDRAIQISSSGTDHEESSLNLGDANSQVTAKDGNVTVNSYNDVKLKTNSAGAGTTKSVYLTTGDNDRTIIRGDSTDYYIEQSDVWVRHTSTFAVGNNSKLFQVDNNGNLVAINGVVASWPSSQGAINSFLMNDGSGGYSWAAGGAQGTTGPQGFTGAGVQGVTGSTGTAGVQGLTGATGAGTQGFTGSTGSTGIQGFTGDTGAGVQGFTGDTGVQGFTGSTGGTGATGSGVQGFAGVQGNDGATGSTGNAGVQGFTGNAGVQGFTGSTGGAGVQGFTGTTGGVGVQGFTGNAGVQGVTGTTGNAGVQGFTGVQGFQGSGTSIISGTPSATQVAVFTGASTIAGNAGFKWDTTNNDNLTIVGAATRSALQVTGSGNRFITIVSSTSNEVCEFRAGDANAAFGSKFGAEAYVKGFNELWLVYNDTGSGSPKNLLFKNSSTVVGSFDSSNNFNIGTGTQFQVTSSGAIVSVVSIAATPATGTNTLAADLILNGGLSTGNANSSSLTQKYPKISTGSGSTAQSLSSTKSFVPGIIYTITTPGTRTASTNISGGLFGSGVGSNSIDGIFRVGRAIKLKAIGTQTTSSSPPNITMDFKIGTTVIATTGAVTQFASQTSAAFEIEAYMTCLTTGSSGTVRGDGIMTQYNATNSNIARNSMFVNSTTYDTTSSNGLDLFITFSAGTAGNTVTINTLIVEVLN